MCQDFHLHFYPTQASGQQNQYNLHQADYFRFDLQNRRFLQHLSANSLHYRHHQMHRLYKGIYFVHPPDPSGDRLCVHKGQHRPDNRCHRYHSHNLFRLIRHSLYYPHHYHSLLKNRGFCCPLLTLRQ